MREEFKDVVTHSYLEIKKIRKNFNQFVDDYRDIFDSDTEDTVLEAKKLLNDIEQDLLIEVHTTIG